MVGLSVLVPAVSQAEQSAARRVPHVDASPAPLVLGSLQVGFRDPERYFDTLPGPGQARGCGDRCFSLTSAVIGEYGQLKSAYSPADFSVNLARSGPVSLRFNGRRLRMQVRF